MPFIYKPLAALALSGTLIVIGCQSGERGADSEAPGQPLSLTDSAWKLQTLEGSTFDLAGADRPPFIIFDAEAGQITGYSGCNNFFGGYEVEGSSLHFGPIGSTRRACSEPIMRFECRFLRGLERIDRFTIEADSLTLISDNTEVARFLSVPRDELDPGRMN